MPRPPADPFRLADLLAPGGRGVARSATSADLNVNVVVWPPGGGVGAHENAERDALWVVLAGAERAVRAGTEGIRYVSALLRRPLGIAPS